MPETPFSADIKPPVGSTKSADKMPFSDKELSRIMRACDNPPRPMRQRDRSPGHVGCEYKNAQGAGSWTGEDLKDLIELMVHTGFRISDATLFDISRLQGNNVMIRAQKNGHHVFAWLAVPRPGPSDEASCPRIQVARTCEGEERCLRHRQSETRHPRGERCAALWSALERPVCFQWFSRILAPQNAAPFYEVTTTCGR